MRPDTEDIAQFVGGFVAAEGCFSGDANGRRFSFQVGLGASDRSTCEELLTFFGVGRVVTSPRRKDHYDDEVTYAVRSIHDLIGVIIPFMDEHLPESYKREQYLAWRERLFEFWDQRARRARVRITPCSVDGCDGLQRALGLCRHHYYLAHRR